MQIDKKKNRKVSEEFLPYHDFLNYCSACLSSIITYADKNHLSKDVINYKSDNERMIFEDICKNTDKDAEQWLIDNGYKDTVFNFYFKHLFFSLLVDFCNYYNASIEMAFDGNIYVAWSLLRKPLQETLAYLEWLYVDKDELLTLMIDSTDVSSYEIIKNKPKIKQHIELIRPYDSSEKTNIYDFRYSYKNQLTLNGILQATNHLITTRPYLKTSPSGLNFIFPDDDSIHRNTGFYYTSLLYVMKYTVDLVMKMFENIAELSDYTIVINSLNVMLKAFQAMSVPYEKAKELLGLEDISIYCPVCGQAHSEDEIWINFAYGYFECSTCHKKVNTYQYMFDFEDIAFVTDEEENNG